MTISTKGIQRMMGVPKTAHSIIFNPYNKRGAPRYTKEYLYAKNQPQWGILNMVSTQNIRATKTQGKWNENKQFWWEII